MANLTLKVELKNTSREQSVRVHTVGCVFKNSDNLRHLLSKVLSSLFEEVLEIYTPYGESKYNLKEVVFGNSIIEHPLYVELKNGTRENFSIITIPEGNPTIEGTYNIIQKSIVDTLDKVKKIIKNPTVISEVKTGFIELDI